MYDEIKAHLDTGFIETEKISRILSLAFQGEQNCILWGDAGHGKSLMVVEAIEGGLGIKREDYFVQSFGEGMSEDRLYGGMDFKKLNKEDLLEFHPERSFLNYEIAVFEEILDAPPIVLLALKDTLTAKEMRNGLQRYPMKTKTIIGLTNKPPSQFSELGPDCHALIERFPLQMEVKWDEYNMPRYLAMFEKVKTESSLYLRQTLARLIEMVFSNDGFISPRSAIYALETLIVASSKQGMTEQQSFQCLQYVPGFESVLDEIEDIIRDSEMRLEASEALQYFDNYLVELEDSVEKIEQPIVCLNACNKLEELCNKVDTMPIPDEMVEKRHRTRAEASRISNLLTYRARTLALLSKVDTPEKYDDPTNKMPKQLSKPPQD